MKTIIARNGMILLVDDDDFERVSVINWSIKQNKKGRSGKPYAHAWLTDESGRKTVHVYLARMIMRAKENQQVDHRDGNTLDNRKYNLRRTNNQGNHRGKITKKSGCLSKYRGVSWNKNRGKWIAQICTNKNGIKKSFALGYFNSEIQAALAYNKRATEIGYFPEALNKVA